MTEWVLIFLFLSDSDAMTTEQLRFPDEESCQAALVSAMNQQDQLIDAYLGERK